MDTICCSDSGEADRCDGRAAAVVTVDDDIVLHFLDSADEYLLLHASLSSILRQGWLDLASARHSAGISRVSSTLYDLKVQPAATTLCVENSDDGYLSEPHFILTKWASSGVAVSSEDTKVEGLRKQSDNPHLRRRGQLDLSDKETETCSRTGKSFEILDSNKVQRARTKSLSVFGALVSPKLRSAQISFEKALEIAVEIANMQSSMLSAHKKLNT